MSDYSVVEDKPAHRDELARLNDVPVSKVSLVQAKPRLRMSGVIIEVMAAVLGLLFLFFYNAMGGGFALAGPWVILLGIFSYQKRGGWQAMGLLTGASMICISVVILVTANQHAFWCITGALLGLVSGSAYIAATMYRIRKRRPSFS
jgi:hypothetical protein